MNNSTNITASSADLNVSALEAAKTVIGATANIGAVVAGGGIGVLKLAAGAVNRAKLDETSVMHNVWTGNLKSNYNEAQNKVYNFVHEDKTVDAPPADEHETTK